MFNAKQVKQAVTALKKTRARSGGVTYTDLRIRLMGTSATFSTRNGAVEQYAYLETVDETKHLETDILVSAVDLGKVITARGENVSFAVNEDMLVITQGTVINRLPCSTWSNDTADVIRQDGLPDHALHLTAGDLSKIRNTVLPTIAPDETRPALSGVLVERGYVTLERAGITFVAADGFRMGVARLQVEHNYAGTMPDRYILPADVLRVIPKQAGNVQVCIYRRQIAETKEVQKTSGTRYRNYRQWIEYETVERDAIVTGVGFNVSGVPFETWAYNKDAYYPDWKQIVPDSGSTQHTVTLDLDVARHIVDVTKGTGTEYAFVATTYGGLLVANWEKNSSKPAYEVTTFDLEYEGVSGNGETPFAFSLNAGYLRDALMGVFDENEVSAVCITGYSPNAAFVVHGVDVQVVVMPLVIEPRGNGTAGLQRVTNEYLERVHLERVQRFDNECVQRSDTAGSNGTVDTMGVETGAR